MPEATIRSMSVRYCRVAKSASAIVATLSPSMSSVCSRPPASMARAASTASSTVSPAMKRRAKLCGRRIAYRDARCFSP